LAREADEELTMKIYEYAKCTTCQKALKFLDGKKLKYQKIPIAEHPPSMSELKKMIGYLKADGGSFKNLFNTSGILYREFGISDKLKKGMTESAALDLLSKHGKLIKRPFLLTENGGTVGFKEEKWKQLLK
jgi:arsenate reductase